MTAAARVSSALLLSAVLGCSDELVDGSFTGDASVHLNGIAAARVANPERVRVGALWLGYSAAIAPASGIEPVVLPVSSISFPPSFTYDVLEPPPSVGHYATADGRIIPASVRFARFILFDDVDEDGALGVDATGELAPPDRLVARAQLQLLLFVRRPLAAAELDVAGGLLDDWGEASVGYHLVELDASVPLPDFLGSVVPTTTSVTLTPAEGGRVF